MNNNPFPKYSTAHELYENGHLDNIQNNKPLYDLINKLNSFNNFNYNEDDFKDSIMTYENLCDHNDGYLCEHRLLWIINNLELKKK